MVKRKKVSGGLSVIDQAVRSGSLIVGFKSVIKALHEGVVSEVFVSVNGRSFIPKLKLVSGSVPVKLLDDSSRELGVRCKMPFSIAVLGLRKGVTVGSKPTKALTVKKKVSKKKSVKKKGSK